MANNTAATTKRHLLSQLPIPSKTLQGSLSQLALEDTPVSQRRSTTFKPSTQGIWARVNPLWTSWPLRLTKEEVEAMGVNVDDGGQVSVVDVLKRWDPVESVAGGSSTVEQVEGEAKDDRRRTSKHRLTLEAHLLGVSPGTLKEDLPHLDIGDAEALSKGDETSGDGQEKEARDQLVDILSGRHVIRTEDYGPWSTRYCGHQFGQWAGQLGDGRAISILETQSEGGGRQEIQLKGAGRTPFSRHADGLAVLRSGVREYLGCEAVAALGIPTTRSLALLTADSLPVIRETGPEPTSLTARIAPSFIRIGHFQALNPGEEGRNMRQIFLGGGYLNQEGDKEGPLRGHGNLEGLRELTEWCKVILTELGAKVGSTKEFFEEVVRRNAEMVAGWQVYGFCHGVINTDNVSILGLTIDYGPYAFMDVYDESHICNHSDPTGLYNYRNQPSRILFALDKLQQALAPLIGYELSHSGDVAAAGAFKSPSEAESGIDSDVVDTWTEDAMQEMEGWEKRFYSIYRQKEREGWMKRFGLQTSSSQSEIEDASLIRDFLTNLHTYSADINASFRHLTLFSPSSAMAPGSDEYLDTYIDTFVRTCSTLRGDEVESAKRGWKSWLAAYAKRASFKAEQEVHTDSQASGDVRDTANGHKQGVQGWETNRKAEMQSVNPRFVLRQWVLEETIAKMEEALGRDGDREEVFREARKRLDKVLQMASHPYAAYGEGQPNAAGGISEEARLCGLGATDMLGFQCSCSS